MSTQNAQKEQLQLLTPCPNLRYSALSARTFFVAEKRKTFLAENADFQFLAEIRRNTILADLAQKNAFGMSTQKAQKEQLQSSANFANQPEAGSAKNSCAKPVPQSAIFSDFSENLFVAEKRKIFLAENADLQFLAEIRRFSTAETCLWHVNAESAEGAAATICEFCKSAKG